ncbi:MAG TPA: hypothetical protein VFQ35_24820, partial [Polyangiaceae bacterium]|nr:hypothetical protein [Polyangiaceae bacterium]
MKWRAPSRSPPESSVRSHPIRRKALALNFDLAKRFWLPCALATLLSATSLASGRALDDWLIALIVSGRAREVG